MLHCVCRGPKESVDTLKWLLEVMPHLKNQEILMMKNVRKHKGTGHFTTFCSYMYMYIYMYIHVGTCSSHGTCSSLSTFFLFLTEFHPEYFLSGVYFWWKGMCIIYIYIIYKPWFIGVFQEYTT